MCERNCGGASYDVSKIACPGCTDLISTKVMQYNSRRQPTASHSIIPLCIVLYGKIALELLRIMLQ